jgi:hypothetical protein
MTSDAGAPPWGQHMCTWLAPMMSAQGSPLALPEFGILVGFASQKSNQFFEL